MRSSVQHESLVLPSIHEMFPEHLLRDGRHASSHRTSRCVDTVRDASYPSVHSTVSRMGRRSVVLESHQEPASPYPSDTSKKAGRHYFHSDDKAPIYSFDVLRSDPSSSSLQHIASSATFNNQVPSSSGHSVQGQGESSDRAVFRVSASDHGPEARGVGYPSPPRSTFINAGHKYDHASARPEYSASMISFPIAGSIVGPPSGRGRSPDDPDALSDDDLSGSNNGKKHVCSTCFKRFNRPSSLRIHVNTHTGETPFRCPWPNCAREFNVNSNMRRHYRNHTAPGSSRTQTVDNRRRRKRGPSHSLVFMPGDPRTQSPSTKSFSPPPISSLSTEEDSDENYQDGEEDELDSLPDDSSPIYSASEHSWATPHGISAEDPYTSRTSFSRYSQSNIRSGPPSYSNSSSSSSPSPTLRSYTYSPSAPYSRSFADSKVSTALRPAFHSKPVSVMPTSDVR